MKLTLKYGARKMQNPKVGLRLIRWIMYLQKWHFLRCSMLSTKSLLKRIRIRWRLIMTVVKESAGLRNVHQRSPARTSTSNNNMPSFDEIFKDNETIWIEPWRAKPFPVIKDLLSTDQLLTRSRLPGGLSQ